MNVPKIEVRHQAYTVELELNDFEAPEELEAEEAYALAQKANPGQKVIGHHIRWWNTYETLH